MNDKAVEKPGENRDYQRLTLGNHTILYFRIDDISDWEPYMEKMFDYFLPTKIPVNLQVIPGQLTDRCAIKLLDLIRENPGLILIGQHGFEHRNHGDTCQYEFGNKRTYRQQYNDIARGYLILKRAFKEHFFEMFTPPHNVFNEHTLDICNRLHYKVLSHSTQEYLAPHEFSSISPQIDLVDNYESGKLKSYEELIYQFEMHYFKSSVIGILLHPEVFSEDGLQLLGRLVHYIKSKDHVRFLSLESIWRLIANPGSHPPAQPDVLLVTPSHKPHWSDCVPTGIVTLATYVKHRGYQVELLDLNLLEFEAEDAADFILNLSPRVLGISCLTRHALRGYELAGKLKERNADIRVVYGGVHPTVMVEEAFELGNADYVVLGEGEFTFVELLDFLLKGEGSLSEIDGLSYKVEGVVKNNRDRAFIDPLDQLPLPDYTLLEPKAYNSDFHLDYNPYESITLMTSRGCRGNCSYCNSPLLYKHRIRYYSLERILDQLTDLVYSQGITQIHFHDDNFLDDGERLEQFCRQVIERRLRIKWVCLTDVRSVLKQAHLLPLMRKSGCIGLEIGMETYSDEIIKYMNKTYRIENAKHAVTLVQQNGIAPFFLIMVYFVGETVDSPYLALRYFYELTIGKIEGERIPDPPWKGLYLWSHLTRVSPGCALYDNVDKYGINLARTWDHHVEERVNFIPYSFLNDTVAWKRTLENGAAMVFIEAHRKLIWNCIDINFYCYMDYLESFMPFNQFLSFMLDIYEICDGKTVKDVCLQVSPEYGEMTGLTVCALAMLSIIRLIGSANTDEHQEKNEEFVPC